jgi:hypothetical protein
MLAGRRPSHASCLVIWSSAAGLSKTSIGQSVVDGPASRRLPSASGLCGSGWQSVHGIAGAVRAALLRGWLRVFLQPQLLGVVVHSAFASL